MINSKIIDFQNSETEEILWDAEEELKDDKEEIRYSTFSKLIKLIRSEEYQETVRENLNVSKIELLFAIVKFCSVYNLPLAAKVDLVKMINSFFDSRVLPDTKYFFNKFFKPDDAMDFHAMCPTCKIYVKKFNESTKFVHCQSCGIKIELKTTDNRNFFVTFDVRTQIRDFIETNSDYYLKVVSEPRDGVYRDIYDGKVYKQYVACLPAEDKQSYATMIFNTDGASVFKSSTYSLWPIQLTLNELPFRTRHDNPIVFALWFGKDKPILSAFLEEFTKQMNVLASSGIKCNFGDTWKTIKVFTICACVDTVARAPMLCFTQFNGKYGCNWCLHPGVPTMHVKKGYKVSNLERDSKT